MAKKDKKLPKYMQQPPAPVPAAYKGGNQNPERKFSIMVPVLNQDGTLKLDSNGFLVRENVDDIYEWNQKHRTRYVAGNGRWTCPANIEGIMFLKSRSNGCFCHWKGQTHKGWGVCIHQEQAHVIGQGVGTNNQMVDVKVCKFVESTIHHWHGYPIDYRAENDIICDSALFYWEKMHLIDKSEITDIQSKEDSSLI